MTALAVILAAALAVALWFWRKARQSAAENSALYEQLVRTLQADKAEAVAQYTMHAAVFKGMVEGCLILDTHHRILSANRALLRLFDLQGEPVGRPLLEALRHHQLLELVEAAHQSGKVEGYELQLPRGKARVLQVNAASVIAPGNRPIGTVLVFHDITRIKDLENVRKDFVANVSHELRTPVTLVQSAVETLLSGAKDDPDARDRFLATIQRQAQRLTLLLDDLLAISELESGRARLDAEVQPIHPIAEEVARQLASRAAGKQISIENNIPVEASACVDGARLEQVFLNLLDNAVKYTQEGGRVELGAERASGSTLRVFVRDNGPGIPREACERVFERFYRVDKGRSRSAGGTGLGLSIVKHIVQAHGGSVWVESSIGNGCSFVFTLPTHR